MTADDSSPELPGTLRAAIEAPPVPPKGWQDGVAPAFISLFLSVVFLDRLAPGTLLVGGIGPAAVGAGMAGLLGYWCLYYAPAMWGASTRRPLAVVATSTFGARGAAWLPGLLIGVVYVIWFAITIDYAALYGLSGLVGCGMLDPRYLATSSRGAMAVPSTLYLVVVGTWAIASAVIGTLAVRLVSAVMSIYVIFPAIVLGITLLWAMPSVPAGPVASRPFDAGGGRALATMFQLVFAFLACHGLTAADWGAATRSARDVRFGGWAGVIFAPPILSVISLLIVAGALGRDASRAAARSEPVPGASAVKPGRFVPIAEQAMPLRPPPTPGTATLREVYLSDIGGRIGGTALLILALGLLGPACSTPFVIGRQFSAVWPRVPRWAWSLLGAVATLPMIASGVSRDVGLLFGLIGGLTAPAVGAIAADYARNRGVWPGPRRGVNLAGWLAWGLGVVAASVVAQWGGANTWARPVPSSAVSFAVAFAAYLILAMLRLEPGAMRLPQSGESPSETL